MTIEEIILSQPPGLRNGLRWFGKNAGRVVPWVTQLKDGTRLFSTPKGIYKPENSEYALSVRQTLRSPYYDREPIRRPDGTWTYMYFQEGVSPNDDDLFTNRALKRCMEDGVPVGVARQRSAKPDPTTYEILGIAKVTGWKDGFFQLDGYSLAGTLSSQRIEGPLTEDLTGYEVLSTDDTFDPGSQTDARERVLREIVRRRGQGAFRANLLRVYGGRCAITACGVQAVLEAAHVSPYLGLETNRISNGILLRADIHTLWDLGLIAIDPNLITVWTSPNLSGSEYEKFSGSMPLLPKDPEYHPSRLALATQWELTQL